MVATLAVPRPRRAGTPSRATSCPGQQDPAAVRGGSSQAWPAHHATRHRKWCVRFAVIPRPRSSVMNVVDIVILASWLAFWLYWVAASVGVKAGQSRWTGFAGLRVGVILVILLSLRVKV